MQIDGYVQALREDLARIAAVGDESPARAAELLAGALESALGRRLLEALGEAALELSGQLEEGRGEVRFAGSDPELLPLRGEGGPAAEPRRRALHGTDLPPPAGQPQGAARSRRRPRWGLREHVARA